jgi:hypothetical protein
MFLSSSFENFRMIKKYLLFYFFEVVEKGLEKNIL